MRNNFCVSAFLVFIFALPVCSKDTVSIKGESMEFRSKGLLTVYRNGVVIRRGSDWVKAREAVSNEKTGEILIEGKITAYYLSEKGDVIRATASRARYNKEHNRGVLYGNPEITVENAEKGDGNLKISADIIEMDERKGLMEAGGGVHLSNVTMDVWSERAVYEQEEGKIVFTGGDPFIVSIEDGVLDYYQSETITVLTEEQTVIFNNRVKNLVWGGSKDAAGKRTK